MALGGDWMISPGLVNGVTPFCAFRGANADQKLRQRTKWEKISSGDSSNSVSDIADMGFVVF